MEGLGCLVSLGQNQRGHARPAKEKLGENRVYLDSCLSFHQVCTKKYLHDVNITMTRLKIDCNTGTTYYKRKGWRKAFYMWLVESGIANILRVPELKTDGFTISYNSKRDWVVSIPEGEKIVFKKDTGNCKGSTFIEMGSQEALEILQYFSKLETVRGNYEGFTKKDAEKAILYRKAQTNNIF